MDAAQCGVAVLHGIDDDAHGNQIEDVVELATLLHHLLVDAPQVLPATGHLGGDVHLLQAPLHLCDRLRQVELALW